MTSCGHQGTPGQQLSISWQHAGSRQGVSGLHMQRVQVIFTRISADCQAWHVPGSIRRVLGEARALGIATPLHCAQVSRARLRTRVLVPPPWPASRAVDSSSRPAPRSSAATSCHSSLLVASTRRPPAQPPRPLVAAGFTDLLCSSCRRRRRHLPAPAASRPSWAPPPPPSAAHALWSPSPWRQQPQRTRPRLLRAFL